MSHQPVGAPERKEYLWQSGFTAILGSGSRRRVIAAATIMGIDVEPVNIDLFKGESHTPEFLRRNPHGLSPVMVDDGVVLYESSAINIYLAEKSGSDLLGATGAINSCSGCSGRVNSGGSFQRSPSMSGS
ncbi:glutathione S-transferase family protein [Rhizobium halophytocola]|uniref:GST N-terminal domain-containing protein n=1 Tax=Rhizobium halophytocola TaxID=735519 RepID=A0ABS4DUH0_9HYPH|nr:glutathione S-transferase N-terminal domain-containing protein [Rhizobium halophytocola]MBP1849348.1 hypothetical protein [Rhizobium halophytocola]